MLTRLRLWDGLRPRIGLLILAHTAILTVLLGLVVIGVGGPPRTMFRLPMPLAVASMAAAFERIPDAAYPQVAAALSVGGQQVSLLRRFPNDVANRGRGGAPALARSTIGPGDAATLENVSVSYREALGSRPFRIQTEDGANLTNFGGGKVLSAAPIRILIALKTGRILAIEHVTMPIVGRFVSYGWPLLAAIVFLELLGMFVLAAQTTRPLSKLAQAVQADGRGAAEPHWPLDGPREIRELALAFLALREGLHTLVEERTRILAAVAHDFRTYLTRLQLRSDYVLDEKQRVLVLRDLKEMSALIDDTLAFAEHTARSRVSSEEIADLASELESMRLMRREANEDVEVLPSGARPFVRIASVDLRRILSNLLDNAVRYGGNAQVTVMTEDGAVILRVDDDGPGVPDDQISDLTKPFHRLESSRARHTGGSGLGLAIVQALVDRHGGTLLLANRPRGGFRATVRLRTA